MKSSRNSLSNLTTTGISPKNDDNNQKLLQDLIIINSKISDITGEQIPTPKSDAPSIANTPSSFVNSLRSITDNEKVINPLEEKLRNIEKVIVKIIELDKIVLRKTMDISSSNDESSVRRSKSLDLYSLSTHMQIIDRLLDLFNKSRRLSQTNILITHTNNKSSDKAASASKLNVSGEGIVSPRQINNSTSNNANLQLQITKLIKQLDESESKRKLTEAENNSLRKKLSIIQLELKSSKDNYDNLYLSKNQSVNELNNKISELLLSNENFENNFIKLIQDKIVYYNSTSENKINYESYNLSNNVTSSLESLDSAISTKMSNKTNNNSNNDMSLLALKEMFESEIASINLEKSLIQNDLTTIQSEFNALRIAYQNLELELQDYKNVTREKIDSYENENSNMKIVINDNHKHVEKLSNDIIDLTNSNFILNDEKIVNDNRIKQLTDENNTYIDINNKLKDKIRSLKNNNENFYDTFEEVMKDEMLTMKKSFEEKLKVAKEEADERSRLHSLEIQRLKKLNNIN